MGSKAQASLEYLMTYGWALILIATVLGALVFVLSSPASGVTFSSSDPTKILLKGGALSSGVAEVKLQNITGGKIEITAVTPTGYSGCKIDGLNPPIEVKPGSQMTLECTAPSDGKGSIQIDYTDFASLQRSVIINASGGAAAQAALITFSQTYGGSSSEYGYSVVSVSDGFVIAGRTGSFGSGSLVYLLKTDVSGNLLWEKNFGGSGDDTSFSVVSVSDGFVITGWTDSFGSGFQAYLIKTDLSGNQ